MHDISFVITSIKPYNLFAKKVIDNIYKMNGDIDFEVIVCHPDKVDDRRVRWIKDSGTGNNHAINFAAKKTKSRYISFLSDDNLINGDLFGIVKFLDSKIFKNRKFKIATIPAGQTTEITKIERFPSFPKPLLATNNFFKLPDINVMCHPTLSIETLELLDGYVFHPYIKYFFDWWLGAYLFLNNENGLQYNGVTLSPIKNGPQYGYSVDKICGIFQQKYFGESYVNIYRLIKNYTIGDKYVYDSQDDLLTENNILNKISCMNANRLISIAKPRETKMKYYRLIFKKENNQVVFSEIIEQEIAKNELESMNWDAPIIRHEIAGHIHFLALDRDYLDAMLLGIGIYQTMNGIV